MRPRLALTFAAVLGAAVVPVTVWSSSAEAAATPACKSSGVATSTCVITWTGNAFSPSTLSVQAGVAVEWANQGQGIGYGALTVTPAKGAPNQFAATKVQPGETSKPVVMAKSGTETVEGSQRISPIQTNVNHGVIHVVPKPASPPPATHSPAPASHPAHQTTKPTSKPAAAPAPAPAPPTGVTNPPPLGIGTVPAPAPSPAGPGPQVAGPQPVPVPTETAAPTTAVPAQALSQSVPARKYGLPGALAAVLLAGVAVGVVRLARVEYANGNGNGNGSSNGPGAGEPPVGGGNPE